MENFTIERKIMLSICFVETVGEITKIESFWNNAKNQFYVFV